MPYGVALSHGWALGLGRRHGLVGQSANPRSRSEGRVRPSWDSALASPTASLRAAATPAPSPANHRGGMADRCRGAGDAIAAGLRRWAPRPGGGGHGGRGRGGPVAGRVGGTRSAPDDAGAGRAGLLDGDQRAAVGAAAGSVDPQAVSASARRAARLDRAGRNDPDPAG